MLQCNIKLVKYYICNSKYESFLSWSFQKVKINREEMLLGQEVMTQYGQIQSITTAREPYEKLWRTAVTFHKEHDNWMNGPLLKVNAEVVDEEVSREMPFANCVP